MDSSDKNHSGETARNFHKILKVLLKQETGIPNFSYHIGNRIKIVTLLVPLFLVVAASLEADKITGRKAFYTDVRI